MPKWANTEQWTNTALAVMQAERNGDTMGAEQALKSLTSAYESIGSMKATQAKLAMIPIELQNARTAADTAKYYGMEVKARADKITADIANEKAMADQMREYALKHPEAQAEYMQIADKIQANAEAIEKQTQVSENIKAGTYGQKSYQESQEAGLKGDTAMSGRQYGLGKETGYANTQEQIGKGLTTVDLQKGERDIKVGQGMVSMEEGRQKEALVSAKITDLLQTSGGLQDPGKAFVEMTKLDNTLNTQLRQLNALRMAVNRAGSSGTTDFYSQMLSKIGPELAAPSVEGMSNEEARAMVNSFIDTQTAEIEKTQKIVSYIQKGAAREQGVPEDVMGTAKTSRGVTSSPIYFNESVWDGLGITLKNAYKSSAKAGLFIKTDKGSIPVDEYERTQNVVPSTTSESTVIKKPAEVKTTQKTGNTNKEKPISLKARTYIDAVKKLGVNRISDIPPNDIARLKNLGIYEEVLKGLGGK